MSSTASPTEAKSVPDQSLPWAPIPQNYKDELITLANGNKLAGLPPQVLSWIMEAESAPSYKGGGWNGVAGGWFGLESPDIAGGQATITSQDTFDQQAAAAASIFNSGLKASNGNLVQAENYYQTGVTSKYDNGAKIFLGFLNLNGAGAGTIIDPNSSLPGASVNNVGGTIGAVAGGLSGLGGLESGINTLLTDITSASWWERLGLFVGGGILIIIGIVVFISTTKTGQKVESDAAVAAVA